MGMLQHVMQLVAIAPRTSSDEDTETEEPPPPKRPMLTDCASCTHRVDVIHHGRVALQSLLSCPCEGMLL
jgi:hypothetical protein